MNKALVILVLVVLVQTVPANASPLMVRCLTEKPWGDQTIKVKIDISLPEKKDRFVFFADRDGKDIDVPDETSVGLGSIEITEVLGNAKESRRHDFIVTRLPSDKNSLVGFYLINSYVNSIRAELWETTKTFIYFDTYNNEVLKGECH